MMVLKTSQLLLLCSTLLWAQVPLPPGGPLAPASDNNADDDSSSSSKPLPLVLPNTPPLPTRENWTHNEYTSSAGSNGFSLAAGSGIDYKMTRALAFRVADLEYTRSWVSGVSGMDFQRGVQFSTGLVLRMGTW
jgi:hypothetical protein